MSLSVQCSQFARGPQWIWPVCMAAVLHLLHQTPLPSLLFSIFRSSLASVGLTYIFKPSAFTFELMWLRGVWYELHHIGCDVRAASHLLRLAR